MLLSRAPLAFAALAALAFCGVARAQDADVAPAAETPALHDATHAWEAAALVTYATTPIAGATTPFGAGLGVRAGARVRDLYLGAALTGFAGGTDVDVTERSLLYGGQVGYDLHVDGLGQGWLTVRPVLGLGGLTVFRTDPSTATATPAATSSSSRRSATRADVVTSASGRTSSSGSLLSDTTTTVSNLYVEPGVFVFYSAERTFIGIGGTMLIVPGIAYAGGDATTWLAYSLSGQLGFRM